ncbi:MAG: Tat pathway signal protein [Rhizobiaceae bacterium]|nr:Tat pathway signal protein [Rhizobiaceae bacterium]
MLDVDGIMAGLQIILNPGTLALIVVGVLIGIIVGVIPGLSATMAVVLLIPFTFQMDPVTAMALLVVVYVGGISGGALTAILIRMPGTPASVATTLDGYPMAQQGKAGQAIGNAVVASFVGTVISAIFLISFAPSLAQFAVRFFYPEYVAVCLFALVAVISVSGNSLMRGLVTGMLGLLTATFGLSEVDALKRFTFDIPEMSAGFGLIPTLIGLFAISQLIKEASEPDRKDVKIQKLTGSVLPKLADIRRNGVNYVRSGLIGTAIGILPAVGGAPAGLIAYAQCKNASKTPESFGKGNVDGVISAETANNATIGGALIIALTLGIPGDPPTAILIGGLMIHGLQPGPLLFSQSPEVIFAIYFAVLFGAFAMMVAMILLAKHLARLTEIPKRMMLPFLLIIASAGVFSINNRVFDVGVMVAFGALGYVLERFRYPLAPFVLGMLLGPIIEDNFRRLVEIEGTAISIFTRPISASFIVLSLAFLAYSLMLHRRAAMNENQELATPAQSDS